jgi:hypothetical protein
MSSMIRGRRQTGWQATAPEPAGSWRPECSLMPIDPGSEAGDAVGRSRNAPLAGLAGSSMSHRFRAWTGHSGRRYVFSVFAAGQGAALGGLPTDAPAIVIAAERLTGEARAMLWVDHTGTSPEAFFDSPRVRAVLGRAGCELHLHLLAADAEERRAIVRDLRAGPAR